MNAIDIKKALLDPKEIKLNSFQILKHIAALLAKEASATTAQDLLLRVLEKQDLFIAEKPLLESLVRKSGLFPYLDPSNLDFRDSVAYECHRPENMNDDFVFHREQAEIYRRIMNDESVIVSAPTSFGKSKIIDAVIASGKYQNIVIVVPTLALIDETRRRLSVFSDHYKIVTHLTQSPAKSNIFIFTAERTVAYQEFPHIQFFVIDEFYKINAISEDETRTVSLNQAFYKLYKMGGRFYLLGPSIDHIPDQIESAFRCTFFQTKYSTVASDQIRVPLKGTELERLTSLCSELTESTLIFCKSPARVNDVARALFNKSIGCESSTLSAASSWIAKNFHPEWVLPIALTKGIGIHHGRLPRSIAQYVVRMFNDSKLRFLICTSTLIEGVNTKAKNVVILDNTIAKHPIDFFTFNNIKGRSGRMFEHFVGRVYLFSDPPVEQLPFVDFPLFTQATNTPESLLVQLDSTDLTTSSKERLVKFSNNEILPISTIKENGSLDPMWQLELARHLDENISRYSQILNWSGTPNSPQLSAVCNLIWDYLIRSNRKGGVASAKQLSFKIWQLMNIPSVVDRVLKELEPGKYVAKSADEAVERVFEFERTWAGFEFPRYLMAISRIQKSVFISRDLPFGDYSSFASQVESLFKNQLACHLEEYGIPYQIGEKVVRTIREDDLDSALEKIKRLDLSEMRLDEFELELMNDAKSYIPEIMISK